MDLYLRHGNLYFVPVLRSRLAFAELVRRALRELELDSPWTEEDLLAVGLPASIRSHLEDAVTLLPKVSLILATTPGHSEATREVFPVTPCDPMIEAFRIALDRELPLEFIDLELAPGNLLRGPCLQDPSWPDDTLAMTLGIEKYLNLIEGHFTQPPARFEPVDTWREAVIVSRLRRLQPLWRRVLVVIDAALVRSTIAQLRSPVSPAEIQLERQLDPRQLRYRLVQQLRLEVLLQYLDDYPLLTERYNGARWLPHSDFDKSQELLGIVLECADEAHDLRFSTRQHKTFDHFLRNLLRFGHRTCPPPDVLYDAAASCFGRALAERLYCKLMSYESLVKVERVRHGSSAKEGLFAYELSVKASMHGYVGRSCSPNAGSNIVIPPKREKKEQARDTRYYRWTPESQFLVRMHEKLQHAGNLPERRQRSQEYRGSIGMGIDVRRTLRASFRDRHSLYVKSYATKSSRVSLVGEPVFWVLSESLAAPASFSAGGIGHNESSRMSFSRDFFVGSLEILLKHGRPWGYNECYETLQRSESGSGLVIFSRRCGRITFGFDYDSEESARRAYGEEFSVRFPNHGEFEHPMGCVDREFVDLARNGASWFDIGLLTALKYAKRAVAIVAPPGLVVSPGILRHPVSAGKSVSFISLGRFSRAEREKMSVTYAYTSEGIPDSEAEASFRIIMRGFWD